MYRHHTIDDIWCMHINHVSSKPHLNYWQIPYLNTMCTWCTCILFGWCYCNIDYFFCESVVKPRQFMIGSFIAHQNHDMLWVRHCGNDFIQRQVCVLWCLMYSCPCHTPFVQWDLRHFWCLPSNGWRLSPSNSTDQTGGHSSDSAIIPKSPSSHEVVVITTTAWSSFVAKQRRHDSAQHYGLISCGSLTDISPTVIHFQDILHICSDQTNVPLRIWVWLVSWDKVIKDRIRGSPGLLHGQLWRCMIYIDLSHPWCSVCVSIKTGNGTCNPSNLFQIGSQGESSCHGAMLHATSQRWTQKLHRIATKKMSSPFWTKRAVTD